MKLTATGPCPHCGEEEAEIIRVDTQQCVAYYCILCRRESATGAIMPDIVSIAIVTNAKKIIQALEPHPT